MPSQTLETICGSSPRGRGKRTRYRRAEGARRLIPAWAGKTPLKSRTGTHAPAHPRVGGENPRWPRRRRPPLGSSPRGRGKRPDRIAWRLGRGLIPAWAGKTRMKTSWTWLTPAHPRVGGENARRAVDSLCRDGSSPRGRGKPPPALHAATTARLIPAWAGKTIVATAPGVVRSAHPRVGGENTTSHCVSSIGGGSSPRGRGKPGSLMTVHMTVRLIPAWAGKTSA